MNVRPETIKLLEENIDGNLLDINLDDFLDLTPKAKQEENRKKKKKKEAEAEEGEDCIKKVSAQKRKPSTEKTTIRMGENICK